MKSNKIKALTKITSSYYTLGSSLDLGEMEAFITTAERKNNSA
jgi:hypothetical protein